MLQTSKIILAAPMNAKARGTIRKAGLVFALLLSGMAPAWGEEAEIEVLETCFVAPPEDFAEQIGAFDCGYVVVPENRDASDGARVKLGFVRLPARGDASEAPMFMMAGGPGGTLLTPNTFSLFSDMFLGPLRERRDIVILEERGSFRSIPSLDCPLSKRLEWTANQFRLDRDASIALFRDVFSDCAAQARAHGIDLSQYNSLAIAADIDASRRALGYDRIVYYGGSYGAQLGQHMMRDFPEVLEAVILDGATALSVRSWMQDRVIDVDEGVKHLVATCEADAKCAEAYDIRALLDEAMALFDEGPIATTYTDPNDAGTTVDLMLTEEDLAMAIFEMQTGQIFFRALPLTLHMAVAEGRQSMATVLGETAGQKILAARDGAGSGIATLMHAAVVCSEDPVRSRDDMIVPEDASRFARVFGQSMLEEYLIVCDVVDVPELPDGTDTDPVVDVPTLVLSGWLDVRTPTVRSLEVAKALPNATLVTFREGTHVQLGEINLCAGRIVRDFIADPSAAIDPSCVDEIPARGFVLPDMTMSVEIR